MTKRRLLISLASLSTGATFAFTLMAWRDFYALSTIFYWGSYYILFGLTFLWGFMLLTFLRKTIQLKTFLRESWGPIVFAWGVAAMLAFSVKPYFNVPTGEPHMLNTSKSMFYWKTVDINPSYNPHQTFSRLEYNLDVKPFLFPFLLNLIHTVKGYAASNVFILNFILMGLFLTILGLCAQRALGFTAAAAACLFVASSPLFALCGRSAGADLFFTVFMGAALLCVFQFMKKPSGFSLGFLWVTLLMTAHIREESFIYFFILLGGLGCLGYIRREHLREAAPIALLSPFFFFPIVWQRILKINPDLNKAPTTPWFGFVNFKTNALAFLAGQFNFGFQLPYNTFLHWTALCIFSYLLWEIFFSRHTLREPYLKHFALLLLVCLAAYLTIILSWCWTPAYSSSVSTRFFLPFSVACALSPIIYLATRPVRNPRHSAWALFLSIGLFFLYHPIAAKGDFFQSHEMCEETDYTRDFLKRYDHPDILLIFNSPWGLADTDYRAIDFRIANQYPGLWTGPLQQHAVQEVLVAQRMNSSNSAPYPEDLFSSAGYDLETLAEHQVSYFCVMRISRIKKI